MGIKSSCVNGVRGEQKTLAQSELFRHWRCKFFLHRPLPKGTLFRQYVARGDIPVLPAVPVVPPIRLPGRFSFPIFLAFWLAK
jgi:hypothetical protein